MLALAIDVPLAFYPQSRNTLNLSVHSYLLDSQPPDASLSQTDQEDLGDLDFSLFRFQYQLAVPSGFGDVWKGTYREKAVALKKLKPYMLPDRRRRVCGRVQRCIAYSTSIQNH